jgi:hypothetical protein
VSVPGRTAVPLVWVVISVARVTVCRPANPAVVPGPIGMRAPVTVPGPIGMRALVTVAGLIRTPVTVAG